MLKLIRESTGYTQAKLAERLRVDTATVQGWESGRRPLAALRAENLIRLRSQLVLAGAKPALFSMVDGAIEADLLISQAVHAGNQSIEAEEHLLGATVHQRRLSNLITWPFTGMIPPPLRDLPTGQARRGPVADRPVLSHEEQTRFFEHLLLTADTNRDKNVHLGPGSLLRRQTIYLLGFDIRSSTTEWLRTEQHRALRDARSTAQLPSWVTVRASAIALTWSGDRDPLRAFIQQGLDTEHLEQANLNYWAYWVGEISDVQTNDTFMDRTDPHSWTGSRLLQQLLDRLDPNLGQVELNLHTVWALLLAHPDLLRDHPNLRSAAASKVELLTEDEDLSAQARRELSDIAYAIRLAKR